jgi:phosphatidate phosphatase APP1
MRALFSCALLVASAALANPAVLLQPSVGTVTRVVLSGRVLKSTPSKGTSVVSKNLRLLASNNWVGASVEVSFGGQSATVVSGHDGDFEVTLEPPPGQAFEVGLGSAAAHVRGASTSAIVDVLSPDAPFFVVSDFDDTLAVTNVLDTGKLLKASLAQDEASQPVVAGMVEFYSCLKQGNTPRPAFMLVSGSPIQYLERVRGFLLLHGFPVFGIALRDLGPKTLSNYKQPVIRALLKNLPNKVVLVGDSGEHDPEVYRQLRDEYPGRVTAIYIRDAGRSEDSKRFEGMVLFKQPKDALADAITRGLAKPGCTGDNP